jgi:3-oxoacyl-[acyl-carrier protein] reductase
MLNISLEGQVGIVTGAGSAYGIGRSMVITAAQAGAAAVYACDLNLSYMDDLKQDVKEMGHGTIVEGHFLDVSNEEQTVALLRKVLRNHGRVDFFFANAGYAVYR